MKIEIVTDWLVYSVLAREGSINPQPQYQRTPVWTNKKKQLLIDSILRGYDLPKFYLCHSSDASFEYEVVDGQQRLRAIWEFRKDEYPLGEKSKDIPGFGNLSDKKWSDLSGDQQDQIGKFPLIITMIMEASDEEIQELFLRLQEGVVLNPAEKRNAMLGNMRNFIADLGADHSVFPLTRINGKRFGWHNLAAIVTCLEKAEGPTDVKAEDLSEMYDNNNESFNDNGPIARKVKRHLNYMARVLKNRPPRMNIKWGFVDLYLSEMDRSYVIRNREADFANFYVAFEGERRDISDPRELITQNRSDWDRDLYDYIQAFVRSGGIKQNIKTRHEVYKRRFLKDTQDLIPKDPRRVFTYNERVVIWHRDNGICQDEECGKSITFDEMEADHIISHIKGGITIIDNGQTLCRQCNARKGAT